MTSSPLSDTSDAPLDLTMSRTQEEKGGESDPGGEGIEYIVNTVLINNFWTFWVLPKYCNSVPNQFK